MRHIEHFDLSGGYLTAIAGQQALEQLAAQGLDFRTYAWITCVCAITYAPFLNSLRAVGEETGWRGFLYPQLKAKLGRAGGNVLGGIIWGAWHWPLIALIGYEYGAAAGNRTGYAGFPYSGMALFCLFTIAAGIVHDWLYEKTRSIWYPALFHGAINAQLTLPLLFCKPDTGSYRLLGPAGNGLLSMIPLLVIAGFLLVAGDHMMSDLGD